MSADSFVPKSSFIEKAEYDGEKDSMTLTFKSGSSYQYSGVGYSTWLSFKQAESHSSFYSRLMKGRLSGSPIIRKPVGKPRSAPLTQIKLRSPKPNGNSILNAGINRGHKGLIPKSL